MEQQMMPEKTEPSFWKSCCWRQQTAASHREPRPQTEEGREKSSKSGQASCPNRSRQQGGCANPCVSSPGPQELRHARHLLVGSPHGRALLLSTEGPAIVPQPRQVPLFGCVDLCEQCQSCWMLALQCICPVTARPGCGHSVAAGLWWRQAYQGSPPLVHQHCGLLGCCHHRSRFRQVAKLLLRVVQALSMRLPPSGYRRVRSCWLPQLPLAEALQLFLRDQPRRSWRPVGPVQMPWSLQACTSRERMNQASLGQ